MRRLISVAYALMVATIVGLSAAGGWFYWDRVQTGGEASARALLPKLAMQEIPKSSVTTTKLSSAASPRCTRC